MGNLMGDIRFWILIIIGWLLGEFFIMSICKITKKSDKKIKEIFKKDIGETE